MVEKHSRVAVVIGSTRPSRICADVARWVRDALAQADAVSRETVTYDLLDLADVDLPLLDEPLMASLGQYAHEHTRRWSALAASYEGFVFVAPQYNWGYPAVLKNALDYLYAEWRDKPATVVTYGTRGGGKGAAQLVEVLTGLHMNVLATRVEAPIGASDVDDAYQLVDPAATLAPLAATVAQVADEFEAAFASPAG